MKKIIYNTSRKTNEDRIHTYATAGTYTVTIKGECTSFTSNTTSKSKLTKIVQWGSTGFTNINFRDCINLGGTIPEPSKNSFINVKSMSLLFYKCNNLKGNNPNNLFGNCPEVTSFSDTFNGCSNLTGNLPRKIFDNCKKVFLTKFTNNI